MLSTHHLTLFVVWCSVAVCCRLSAQVTNTNCFSNGVQVQCTSVTSPPPPNLDSMNRSNVAAVGGLIAAIKAKHARHAAEKERQADSTRFAQPAVYVQLYRDSAMTVGLDTATLVRKGSMIEMRMAVRFVVPRKRPGGIHYNESAGWLDVDCDAMQSHDVSGMFYLHDSSGVSKAVDVAQPSGWEPLRGPVGAAVMQIVCGG